MSETARALALNVALAFALATPAVLAAAPVPPPASQGVELAVPAEGPHGSHCKWAEAPGPALVVLAGWRVQPSWGWTWLSALDQAAPVRHATLCLVRGPQDARFTPPDIDTAALALALHERLAPDTPVTLVAHSSGSFVAHRLLRQWRALAGPATLGRVHYVNLDGAVGSGELGMDAELVAQIGRVTAAYAVDARSSPAGESANAEAMRRLHAMAPARVRLLALPADDAGCNPGARWCLHSVLITRRPHDPARFDLARDYGAIGPAHPVQAGFLWP
jgi:hypothetical protein